MTSPRSSGVRLPGRNLAPSLCVIPPSSFGTMEDEVRDPVPTAPPSEGSAGRK